MEIDHIN